MDKTNGNKNGLDCNSFNNICYSLRSDCFNQFISLNPTNSNVRSNYINSNVSDIKLLMESCQKNPESVLLLLDFGKKFQNFNVDSFKKIPYRFFQEQSTAKGINVHDIALACNGKLLKNIFSIFFKI